MSTCVIKGVARVFVEMIPLEFRHSVEFFLRVTVVACRVCRVLILGDEEHLRCTYTRET